MSDIGDLAVTDGLFCRTEAGSNSSSTSVLMTFAFLLSFDRVFFALGTLLRNTSVLWPFARCREEVETADLPVPLEVLG